MRISATIKSAHNRHDAVVQTNDSAKEMNIAVKPTGFGSSVNGGELLMLSLATCFCNDIYREAVFCFLVFSGVVVEVMGEFGAEGEPGFDFRYKANVTANATDEEIVDLIAHTDKVAEIHNTLRKGIEIILTK